MDGGLIFCFSILRSDDRTTTGRTFIKDIAKQIFNKNFSCLILLTYLINYFLNVKHPLELFIRNNRRRFASVILSASVTTPSFVRRENARARA